MKTENPKSGKKKEQTVYKKPILTKLGNMAQVTKKSGGNPDSNQVTKSGGGKG